MSFQVWLTKLFRWGFLVIFWNFAGVPFVSALESQYVSDIELLEKSYIYSVVYMSTHDPENYRFSMPTYVIMYATLLTAYFM